jgi:hypothetical protein
MSIENHDDMMMPAGENSRIIHHSSLTILPAVIWEQVGGMDERSKNLAL